MNKMKSMLVLLVSVALGAGVFADGPAVATPPAPAPVPVVDAGGDKAKVEAEAKVVEKAAAEAKAKAEAEAKAAAEKAAAAKKLAEMSPAERAVAEAVDMLASNHTKIQFVANNITLFDAVLRIKNLSRANIVFSYMEPADMKSETVVTNSALNVAELQVKANSGAASGSRRVTYATSAPMEWRAVLASVLAPDYTFDERDGMVRIATKTKFAALQKTENDEKPMGIRYIRVYNASPEEIVTTVKGLNIFMNSKASIQVAPYKEKVSGSINSYRHNLSSYTTSGTATRGGTSVSAKSQTDAGSWGNLLRPRNPPAILVYDAQENLDKIEETIRTIDVREKQVLIEALILELTDQGAKNLGMNLDKMGLKSINLLNSSWSLSRTKDKTSSNQDTWTRSNTYVNKTMTDAEHTTTRMSGYDHTDPVVNDTVDKWTRTIKGDVADKTSTSDSSTKGVTTTTTTTTTRDNEDGTTETISTKVTDNSPTTSSETSSFTESLTDALSETITGGFTIPGSKGYGDTLYNYGKWSSTSDFDENDTRKGTYTNTRNSGRRNTFSATFGPINFNLVLELVEEEGNGKLLSSPVLTIGDHSEAMLHVGTITPIANVESKYVGDLSSSVAQSVSWLELVSGVMMWVGPEITEDDLVRLWVHPKISEKTGNVASFNGIEYPELQSEEIDTRVSIPSGNTLMIGGLTRNIRQEKIQRVPILGYIPFLGRLFRHTSVENSRQNLVILIRPTILDDENPDTGFEAPAMKVIDPLNAESGRNLKDVKVGENDPLYRNEKKVKEFFLGTNYAADAADAEGEAEETVAPDAEGAEEPEADGE